MVSEQAKKKILEEFADFPSEINVSDYKGGCRRSREVSGACVQLSHEGKVMEITDGCPSINTCKAGGGRDRQRVE